MLEENMRIIKGLLLCFYLHLPMKKLMHSSSKEEKELLLCLQANKMPSKKISFLLAALDKNNNN